MTEKDCMTQGCTVLLYSSGGAIRHIGNIHEYVRLEDVLKYTTLITTTDGMENANHCYDSNQIKQIIKEKETQGRAFSFLVAKIDAVETASRVGIAANQAVNYHTDREGTKVIYETVLENICQVRAGTPMASLGAKPGGVQTV